MSGRIDQAAEHNYQGFSQEIKEYVDQVIVKAVEQNRDLKTLEQIPLVGNTIRSTLLIHAKLHRPHQTRQEHCESD